MIHKQQRIQMRWFKVPLHIKQRHFKKLHTIFDISSFFIETLFLCGLYREFTELYHCTFSRFLIKVNLYFLTGGNSFEKLIFV